MTVVNGPYTEWDVTEYNVIQLLPAGDFDALFYDDDTTPWKLRREKIRFVGLANATTRFYRQPTKNRLSGETFSGIEERLEPFVNQVMVGVDYYHEGMIVVDEFANCLGIIPRDFDEIKIAKERLNYDLISKFDFPEESKAD